MLLQSVQEHLQDCLPENGFNCEFYNLNLTNSM